MKRISILLAAGAILTTAACQQTNTGTQEAQLAAQQKTIDSMRYAMDRQHVIDSMNTVMLATPASEKTTVPAVEKATPVKRSTKTKRSVSQSSSNTYAGHTQPVYTQSAQQPVVYQEQTVKQKKGWSAKAKGAVIGAGVGAATGAIINKRNRGAGAVIGGVLGAGAGTGVGAIIDKKKGR